MAAVDAKKTIKDETPTDVPLFLRKTYHMIDSCDPSVAGWSEDGETFVVKDSVKFEQEIIPQFFKHSKFSSFVRQLNFYSFRKVKYVDTLRLDPKLEAETANYMRFKHEKFQKGKPHLLSEIKRMQGSTRGSSGTATSSSSASNAASKNTASASTTATDNSTATANAASTATNSGENSQAMKHELDSLKKRIEEMNKNMNELTTMVQKVTLTNNNNNNNNNTNNNHHHKDESVVVTASASTSFMTFMEDDTPVGAKRKKMDLAMPDLVESRPHHLVQPLPDLIGSSDTSHDDDDVSSLIRPDEMLSSVIDDLDQVLPMEIAADEPVQLQALDASPFEVSLGNEEEEDAGQSSSSSSTSSSMDAAAADMDDQGEQHSSSSSTCSMQDNDVAMDTTATHLLPNVDDDDDETLLQGPPTQPSSCRQAPHQHQQRRRQDRADPELMERLSEALAVLPKEMQEQIVERLIAAITTTDLFAAKAATSHGRAAVEQDDDEATSSDERANKEDGEVEVGMPLAAATLAALLQHYSAQVKQHHHRRRAASAASSSSTGAKANKASKSSSLKSIPVIPVHA